MYIGWLLQPTEAEFQAAVRRLVTAMKHSTISQRALLAKDIKYGVIGDAAIMFYSQNLGLPWRQATHIEMVFQPNDRISVEEVSHTLSTEKIFTELGFRKHSRSKALQIIVKRGKKDVPVDVKIVDHYVWPQYREYYDLDLSGNERSILQLGDKKLPILNAHWILRQLIREWNEHNDYELKREITIKIKTMCDVLSLEPRKLLLRNKKDIHELRNLRDGFEDDILILSAVIDCPEVLGPWYNLPWVRNLLLFIAILAASLAYDYYASGEIEDLKRERWTPYNSSTHTNPRSQASSVTPVFSRIEDAELQVSRAAMDADYIESLRLVGLEAER